MILLLLPLNRRGRGPHGGLHAVEMNKPHDPVHVGLLGVNGVVVQTCSYVSSGANQDQEDRPKTGSARWDIVESLHFTTRLSRDRRLSCHARFVAGTFGQMDPQTFDDSYVPGGFCSQCSE